MIYPPLLVKGDKLVIVAPSGKLPKNGLDMAIETLTSWGLEVVLGPHVYDDNNYFAGTDRNRLDDLQTAIDDPSISAILCARGGYGLTRIIEELNFENIINQPKWLIGYSDITALNLLLLKHNMVSIHGPMATSFSVPEGAKAIGNLRHLLFSGESELRSTELNENFSPTQAEVTGGNLSLIVDSLGTENEIETDGKILFLEEVGEKTYRIDRMLHQLLRAGKLSGLAGLVVGHFSNISEGQTAFGHPWQDSIKNVTSKFSYPTVFGFKIGHEPMNMPLIVGGKYQLALVDNYSSLTYLGEIIKRQDQAIHR